MDHKELEIKSIEYRKTILDIIYNGGAGHTSGSLSCIDILNVLYNNVLKPHIDNKSNNHKKIWNVFVLVNWLKNNKLI